MEEDQCPGEVLEVNAEDDRCLGEVLEVSAEDDPYPRKCLR